MLATVLSTPISLSPVGHGTIKLHRLPPHCFLGSALHRVLSITIGIWRLWPLLISPRKASRQKMQEQFSAFCLITLPVTQQCAIGFHRFALLCRWPQRSQGNCRPEPHWLSADRLLSRSPRIRTLAFTAQLPHLQ